jgi:cell pole-organizing protein PopZ
MGDLSREPSMEDILSSIRRVIARDEAPGTARALNAADDVLDLAEEEADEADAGTSTADELVSSESADAARQSLDALSAAVTSPAPAAPPAAIAAGGRTMEEVVMETLRPMLKQWLDTNLPGMVETMVAKEISRITGRRL